MGVYKGAFNMSQEYYSVEKESNLGALNIGLSVFQAILFCKALVTDATFNP